MSASVDGGRGNWVASRLQEIAQPQLYQRNPFRITGLPTGISRRALREQRQRVSATLAVGAPLEPGGEFPLPARLTDEQILGAFDELSDARQRLVDEIFWLWDTPEPGCRCPGTLHRDHDAAVRAHLQALDLELTTGLGMNLVRRRDELWRQAAQRWGAVLRNPQFWDHIRHRVATLGDRRLDESVIGALREDLPAALVTPLVTLAASAADPARLVTQTTRWPVPRVVLDELIITAAEPLFQQIDDLSAQAGRDLDAGRAQAAGTALQTTVIPILRRLDTLAPAERHRRTATARNGVAILLNNCAMDLFNGGGPPPTAQILPLLNIAHQWALDPETRQTIEANQQLTQQAAAGGLVYSHRPGNGKAPIRIKDTISPFDVCILAILSYFAFSVISASYGIWVAIAAVIVVCGVIALAMRAVKRRR